MNDPVSERFYGRRKGRPMRSGRRRLMQALLPSLQVRLGDAGPVFPGWSGALPRRLVMEVGFGAGEHLAALALADPEAGFIGCEPFVNGVARLLSRIEDDRIGNIRIWPDDARPLVDALPISILDGVNVLFPDPWPKRRHHQRRFIGPWNLPRLARIMKPGAELRMASDHPGYVAWMLAHVRDDGRFAWTARHPDDWRIRPDDWPQTRYEAKARGLGLTPAYLRFRRL